MNNKTIRIVTIIILVIAVIVAAWWLWTNDNDQSNSTQPAPTPTEAETAIKEAKQFEPNQPCTTVMTPARHLESGATYTFPSGCLPDGWERADSSSNDDQNNQDGDAPTSNNSPSSDSRSGDATSSDRQSQPSSSVSDLDRAHQQARDYKPAPGQSCATVLTPARHIETGATYTFATNCIPPGWKALPPNYVSQ